MAETTTGAAAATPDQAEGGSGSGSALEGMGERVRGAAGEVQQRMQGPAGDAMRKAREQAVTQVDQRSTEMGHRVTQSADDLRSVGEHLRSQGRTGPADLADNLAGRADDVGRYLRDADSNRMLQDFERFGRQRPWAIALAGVVVGLVGARLLKASEQRRYAARQDGPTEWAAPAAPARGATATDWGAEPVPPATGIASGATEWDEPAAPIEGELAGGGPARVDVDVPR